MEKQCGQRCEVKGTWQVGKDLHMKKTNNSVFWNNGNPKLTVSTIVNSWKRHQNPANTNEFASHVNLRSSQNPGRVAKVRNDMLEKRWNGAGSLRAAWPSLSEGSVSVSLRIQPCLLKGSGTRGWSSFSGGVWIHRVCLIVCDECYRCSRDLMSDSMNTHDDLRIFTLGIKMI